jgi:hypothetical protein
MVLNIVYSIQTPLCMEPLMPVLECKLKKQHYIVKPLTGIPVPETILIC